METSKIIKRDGVTIEIANTLRQAIRYRVIRDNWYMPTADGALDEAERALFLSVASYTRSVEGVDWQPPEKLTKPALEKSYNEFLDLNPALTSDWWDDIYGLLTPTASQVEKPDEALTPDESADPN